MTDVPQHDDTDELESFVAHNGTATLAEREAMLSALRRLGGRTAQR